MIGHRRRLQVLWSELLELPSCVNIPFNSYTAMPEEEASTAATVEVKEIPLSNFRINS